MRALILLLIYVSALSEIMGQESPAKKKFVNHTELGGLFGRVKFSNGATENQVESKTSLTMQTFNGIQINHRLSTGLTVGLDWYKTALINPIAAGIRYDLSGKKNARLFATMDAGYGFTWLHQDSDHYTTKGGLMLNPGFGVKYGKPGGSAFTISLTYKRQNAHVNKPLQWEQTVRYEDRVYNRMALKIGMSF